MIPDFAIDTNIAIYALSDGPKADRALQLLKAGPSVSVQLLNEFMNVSLRKRRLPWPEIDELLSAINSLATHVLPVDIEVHKRGREIAKRHKIGTYDSMIIASALLGDCEILYSEDMHHGLVIDEKLTILNPFLEPEKT